MEIKMDYSAYHFREGIYSTLSAYVAIKPPMSESALNILPFFLQINELQRRKFLGTVNVASVVHPTIYPLTHQEYLENQKQICQRAYRSLEMVIKDQFSYNKLEAISSNVSGDVETFSVLNFKAWKHGNNLLIISCTNRCEFLSALLPDVPHPSVEHSRIPVLILKPTYSLQLNYLYPLYLLAIDPKQPPRLAELIYFSEIVKSQKARVKIVYIRPSAQKLLHDIESFPSDEFVSDEISKIKLFLDVEGAVEIDTVVSDERDGIAEDIEALARTNEASFIFVSSPRQGRTIKQLVRICDRPVFILRGCGAFKKYAKG